jgi:hypothetical protein
MFRVAAATIICSVRVKGAGAVGATVGAVGISFFLVRRAFLSVLAVTIAVGTFAGVVFVFMFISPCACALVC